MNKIINAAIICFSVLPFSCINDGQSTKPEINTGLYQFGTGSLESQTKIGVSPNIPFWFSILDTDLFLEDIKFESDSCYFIESYFGTCKLPIGYKKANEVYTLNDSILTIEETNNYGYFKAEKKVSKIDSTICTN
jgi:hypothetical protein